jgi:hypothetical protein
MADLLVDSINPSDQSPWSILNKLPTKRIDAAITRAASTSIPTQGEQTGGYASAYAHLSNLPLLPLYSQAQHNNLAKQQSRKQRQIESMDANDPDKLLTGGQRTFLNVVGHLSGAGGIISMKRWERRLIGANVMSTNFSMQQNKLIVFTRWTIPVLPNQQQETVPWFVDVLEYRMLDPTGDSRLAKMGGSMVLLKVGIGGGAAHGKKVTLRLLTNEAKGLKSQQVWTGQLRRDPCEAVSFVGDDGEIVPMEIVARIQRACSTWEAMEIQKRFKKEWLVPVLQ